MCRTYGAPDFPCDDFAAPTALAPRGLAGHAAKDDDDSDAGMRTMWRLRIIIERKTWLS
jgi:hypothetical protein